MIRGGRFLGAIDDLLEFHRSGWYVLLAQMGQSYQVPALGRLDGARRRGECGSSFAACPKGLLELTGAEIRDGGHVVKTRIACFGQMPIGQMSGQASSISQEATDCR